MFILTVMAFRPCGVFLYATVKYKKKKNHFQSNGDEFKVFAREIRYEKKKSSHRGILTNIWFMFRIQGVRTVENVCPLVRHTHVVSVGLKHRRDCVHPAINWILCFSFSHLFNFTENVFNGHRTVAFVWDWIYQKLSHFLWWLARLGSSFINVGVNGIFKTYTRCVVICEWSQLVANVKMTKMRLISFWVELFATRLRRN